MSDRTTRKVFGVGFSKTGTTSLETALSILGYSVCGGHYNNNYSNFLIALYVNRDYEEILKLTRLFDAFADAPWGGGELYRELYQRYPDADYILTLRDSARWFESFQNMVTKFDKNLKTAFESLYENGRYGTPYFFRYVFNIQDLDGTRLQIIERYEKYNQAVIDFFRANDKELLVLDVTQGDPWVPLCAFLNRAVPAVAFPHANPSKKRPASE